MTVSVIIATMNRPADLRAALDSIEKQTRLPRQVIVVDQSTDTLSQEVARQFRESVAGRIPEVRYEHREEKSLVKARNYGMALATGDILSFLDDDIVLFEDYYEKIAAAFAEDPGLAALSGNTLIRKPLRGWKWGLRMFLSHLFLISHFDGRMTLSGFGYPVYEREIVRSLRVEMLPGCNMNYRKTAIGDERFDEWFSGYGYREDAEFSYRISRSGRISMIPGAKLWHNYSLVSRLTEEQLKPMVIRNYRYVFHKFKERGFFSRMLFCYSLFGLTVIDTVEYLSQRTPAKWGKLKAGVRSSLSVFRGPL